MRDNVEVILLLIVGVSVLPIVVEVLRARLVHRSGPPDPERTLRADVPQD